MNRLALFAFSTAFATACGCSKSEPRYSPERQLSDDDIVAYALEARDPSFREGGGRRVIGVQNGIRVLAEFPVLDDGRSTFGNIHYDVEPGAACKRAGGLMRFELVPVAITAAPKPFCVPKVLVQRNIRITPLG